jgi:DNA-binding beta-propeller fold protein YncE
VAGVAASEFGGSPYDSNPGLYHWSVDEQYAGCWRGQPWLWILGCLVTSPASAAPPLMQLPGSAGCISETGSEGTCVDGVALEFARSIAISPDGRNVYVASFVSDAIAVFDRDRSTGALTQKAGLEGCLSETGTEGICTDAKALDGPWSLALSPDGASAYVASFESGAIAVFDRDRSNGSLTQMAGLAGCIRGDGGGGICTDGGRFFRATSVVVSPDGRTVYADGFPGVAVFDRNPSTGELTPKPEPPEFAFAGSPLAVSPDGRNVYAGSGDGLTVFDRDPSTGVLTPKPGLAGCVSETGTLPTGASCTDGRALELVRSFAISPDGNNVYVAAQISNAVAVFDRDLSTGDLTQKPGKAGCISEPGTGGECTDGEALSGAISLAASPDGQSVLVLGSGAVAVLERNPTTGELTQRSGIAGCVSDTADVRQCTQGRGLAFAESVVVSPDAQSVYVGSREAVAAFTRRVPPYDIDGDGEVEALTDTLLLFRYTFGFRGATLVADALDHAHCTRCTALEIEAFIQVLTGP